MLTLKSQSDVLLISFSQHVYRQSILKCTDFEDDIHATSRMVSRGIVYPTVIELALAFVVEIDVPESIKRTLLLF